MRSVGPSTSGLITGLVVIALLAVAICAFAVWRKNK